MLPCINPTLVTSLAKISFAWRGSSKGGFDDAGGGFGDAAMGNAFEGLSSISDTTTRNSFVQRALRLSLTLTVQDQRKAVVVLGWGQGASRSKSRLSSGSRWKPRQKDESISIAATAMPPNRK
jgi:hypothetical protein